MPELVGNRVQQARARKTMRQSDLARVLGVSRSAVANWESGSARPSSENLGKIALATDCSIDWLATGRGMPSDALMACCDVDMVFEPAERALLRAYRNSHPGVRRLLLQLATRHVETKP